MIAFPLANASNVTSFTMVQIDTRTVLVLVDVSG